MRFAVRHYLALVITAGAVTVLAACGGAPAQPTPEANPSPESAHVHVTPSGAPPDAPLRRGERFVQLAMPRPYTPQPPNGGTDEYRCFLVDPKLTKRTFVTGSQFLPQNLDIVHHAIFFRVEPGEVAEAHGLDDSAPGDGWTCFGGTGLGAREGPGRQLRAASAWIAAWAPGGSESLAPESTGFQLEPGSQIIMQVHYSLLHTGGRPAGPDQSAIRLRVVDSAQLNPLHTTLLPAPVELPCPPGESGRLCDREQSILDVWSRFGDQAGATVAGLNLLCNRGRDPKPGPTQHCDIRVQDSGTVYAVAGHMHLLGRSIKVELNSGTSRAKTLLNVPVYNFDDQGARPVAKPVTVKPGDTFRVTCTHDATLRQKLPELQKLPPRYVVWGDGTSDEMCLGIVIWAQPR